jgi:hypothetical protein
LSDKLKGVLIAAAAAAVLAVGGAAIAGATGGGEQEKPITGAALGKASATALDHTGGGRVTGTEVGDEEGYYEVEVTRSDGSQVDVHLNRDFKVLSQIADEDSSGDQDGSGQ